MVSDKENNPREHHHSPKTTSSQHAARLRDVRDARRKRILARSSERLAYITASAGEVKPGPLLGDRTNSSYTFSLDNVCAAPDAVNAAGDADICKYLSDQETNGCGRDSFDNFVHELRQPCSRYNRNASTISDNSHRGTEKATIFPAGDKIDAETKLCKSPVNINASSLRILSKLNFSMHCPHVQHARFLSVACAALLFMVAGFAYGGGHSDAVFLIYSPLAAVFLTELLLYTGAYFLLSNCELLKDMETSSAALPVVIQLLLTVFLDCSISASLACGGFLVLSKNLPSYHGQVL
ncbi:hypothetical protein L7F22_028002 [Adiantum nelumboides]|nr:hypothetical protein [Adiantum nelumboides]